MVNYQGTHPSTAQAAGLLENNLSPEITSEFLLKLTRLRPGKKLQSKPLATNAGIKRDFGEIQVQRFETQTPKLSATVAQGADCLSGAVSMAAQSKNRVLISKLLSPDSYMCSVCIHFPSK